MYFQVKKFHFCIILLIQKKGNGCTLEIITMFSPPIPSSVVEPGPIDPPLILEVKSRETTISWQPPSRPNGIVTHYNIYQNNQLHDTIPGARSKHIVSFLEPYTVYKFQVEGCTSKGCSLSSESLPIQTLPDAPEDIPAPELYSDTPTSVLVSWQPPLHPNGLVENFTIERRVKGTEQVSTVASFPSNCSKSYLDQSAGLSPWKKYEYRILASTFQGGINSSSWVEVITRPSRPENIQAPKVQALDPYTAQVCLVLFLFFPITRMMKRDSDICLSVRRMTL